MSTGAFVESRQFLSAAFLHFVALFFRFAFLLAELAVCGTAGGDRDWRLPGRLDVGYFICAILVVITGFARVFFGLKNAHYYFHNPMFYALLVTCALIELLSIAPTMEFIKWRKSARGLSGFAPEAAHLKRVRGFMAVELALFCIAPVFAVLMVRGLGY